MRHFHSLVFGAIEVVYSVNSFSLSPVLPQFLQCLANL